MAGADDCSTREDLVSSLFSDSTDSFVPVESYSESELSNDVSDGSGSIVVGCRPQPRRIDYFMISVRNGFY